MHIFANYIMFLLGTVLLTALHSMNFDEKKKGGIGNYIGVE